MTVTTRSQGDRPADGRSVRILATAGLALATVMIVAACASARSAGSAGGDGSTASAAPTTPPGSTSGTLDTSGKGSDTVLHSLVGKTFISTEVKGHALVSGSTIALSFPGSSGPGVLSANAGCNTMSGAAVLDGGVLRVPQLAMTEMGCAADLMAQDTWLAGLLTKGVNLDVRADTIVVAASGITITLTDRKVVEPDLPFVGTSWTLDGIITGDSVTHYADVTATMSTDGTTISYRACNSHTGPISITGDAVKAGPMVSTKMACLDGRADVEKAMEAVLDGTFTFAVDGNHLTVTGADGAGLMFIGTTGDTTTSPGSEAPGASPPASGSGSVAPITSTPVGSESSIAPASAVTPATSRPTVSETAGSRSVAGQHDSIPPQPTPDGQTAGN